MDILKKVSLWANSLTQTGLSILALGVVLEVLFNGAGIPFWPDISAVTYTHLTLPTNREV